MSVDPVYGVNNFNRPKVLTEEETRIANILIILFGKPGFMPSLPKIGMDIEQYLYKFEDDINIEEIKANLITQCRDLQVDISDSFEVYTSNFNNHSLLIFELPSLSKPEEQNLLLGITTNDKGEIIYNISDIKKQGGI